jgi:Na+/proline symporter
MIPALVVFTYLAVVLYVGIFAFRRSGSSAGSAGKEDFFLANRSLGTFVFLLSLFGSNMTSFAILGSSGLSFRQGIGVYGLMASISGLVIPASIFLIGTRLWAIGKRLGHITQVQILRDRFEMGHIGTLVFSLQAIMLVPYIIIGVMGGGETLEGVSNGFVPYWLGGLIVALVVMSYVFFGGMRGTAWVNTMQTIMFLVFGSIAFIVVARGMGGLEATVSRLAETHDAATNVAATLPADAVATPLNSPRLSDGALLTRDRIPFWYFVSYALIPLSAIMFPHIAIFCLTAKKLASFKKTVILYPICIMVIWLPAVFLGAIASGQPAIVKDVAMRSDEIKQVLADRGGPVKMPALQKPAQPQAESLAATATAPSAPKLPEFESAFMTMLVSSKDPAAKAIALDIAQATLTDRAALAERLSAVKDPRLKPQLRRLANTNADGVMLNMLSLFAPTLLAGILGAAIMACVMASDSQILALSTMWAEDIYAYYGGKKRFGEAAQVWSARAFVVFATIVSYIVALTIHSYANIFEIAIQFAFSGYASLAPIMLGALFWKRGTKWGVLASTLWVAACLVGFALLQAYSEAPKGPPGSIEPLWKIGDTVIFMREATRVSFTEARLLLVVPMFAGSALLMWLVSLATTPPSAPTIERYFPARPADAAAN